MDPKRVFFIYLTKLTGRFKPHWQKMTDLDIKEKTRHSKTDLKTKLFLKVREQIELEISHHGEYLKGEHPAAWLSSAISLPVSTFDVCHNGLKAKASY